MAQPSKSQFGYRRHADQDRAGADAAQHPVVVVGAGPVGLSLAIDLAQRGQSVVLLDDADRIGEGSRAICFSKRSLEFWDRLGVGSRMVSKGVVWSVGRIFHGESLLYQFNLLPEDGHKRPAFINLQQFYAEAYLVDRVQELPAIDLRWRNKVAGLEAHNDHLVLTIETPEGPYLMRAAYVVACDGGRSALLHRQPDDIWRIDLQLHPDADPAVEKRPENVRPRIARMLGHEKFEFEWISLYKFQCRRMDKFIHGRVIFAGDAAHQVSPFGARGANSGLEDAENLAWKLDRVLKGSSPDALLWSYHVERSAAADENIRESTRSTDFMAPGSRQEARLRQAVLSLARETEFGKRMINAGRPSVPSIYDSPLSTADRDAWRGGPRPGASMTDAPVEGRDGGLMFLTDAFILAGRRFTLLEFCNGVVTEAPDDVGVIRIGGNDGFRDGAGLAGARYDAEAGTAYLLRPDGYVAARFRHPTRPPLAVALARATGHN